MREIPILFSTPMVQAILDGRKSMTRRVVKGFENAIQGVSELADGKFEISYGVYALGNSDIDYATINCPYGQPGDRLWVKETWKVGCTGDLEDPGFGFKYRAGADDYVLNAYPTNEERFDLINKYVVKKGWQSSRFIPREAARIWLEVTNVRVERLQEITEEDAKAEGITSYWAEPHRDVAPFIGAAKELGVDLCHTRRKAFQQLWDSLNSKRGYGWETNPWVWVVEFRRDEK